MEAGALSGGAIARAFAREGARVFIAGRTQAKLDAVARDIAATGGTVETAQVDVLDQQAVEKHADAIAATAGSIDIALNAVSVMHDQGTLLADLSLEEFMQPIDGFLRTLFITSKAVARHMGRERPGVILTLSEPGSKLAVGGILGHGVSAAGKEAFSRLLAAELAPSNIRSSASVHTLPSMRRLRVPTPRTSSSKPRQRPGSRSKNCSKAGGWRRGLF
jgi:NAD(P)-dependent dehydrogenase (short-subunit alcohol dehydrogenase family)